MLVEGRDPSDLAEAGWGVIFPMDTDPAIREALSELLEHRRSQATEKYYGEYIYRPGESKSQFLNRHGAPPGPVDPKRVPYYLLIVGDPETIPFRFQSDLDVQFAVGRVHFENPEEYASYARTVVEAEVGRFRVPRQVIFFGTSNPDDRLTKLLTKKLVIPLAEDLSFEGKWHVQRLLESEATKRRLGRLLGGGETPGVIFTASHGMNFTSDDPRQLHDQGALLCQDWPGPKSWQGAIPRDYYFSAEAVPADANLSGLIAVFVASCSAGTERFRRPVGRATKERKQIAPRAFVAQLPQKLLAHPRGGALAVLGTINSFENLRDFFRIEIVCQVFASIILRLIQGYPVGYGVENLNQSYVELATALQSLREEEQYVRNDPQLPERISELQAVSSPPGCIGKALLHQLIPQFLESAADSVVSPRFTRSVRCSSQENDWVWRSWNGDGGRPGAGHPQRRLVPFHQRDRSPEGGMR